MAETLLELRNLSKNFSLPGSRETVKAVTDVSLQVSAGETLGLVGESGCGKTTLGRLMLRLLEPSQGSVHVAGQDLAQLSAAQLRALRGTMQVVFQNPFASLNPRMSVETLLSRPLTIHRRLHGRERRDEVGRLLEQVGLRDEHRQRYPHEFSGGQRQRIAMARALAVQPSIIVLDEPTSALDVSVQAQILNLIQGLQRQLGLSYVFISHDLSTVRYLSDRVAVMYLGRIVELATTQEFFRQPRHPYSQALLAAIPVRHPRLRRERIRLQGDIPSPMNLPTGCAFQSRCPWVEARCRQEVPALRLLNGSAKRHEVACHRAESLELLSTAPNTP